MLLDTVFLYFQPILPLFTQLRVWNDIYCLGGGISLPPSHSHLPAIECHSSFWCHQWLASPWESAISAEKHLAMLTSYGRSRFQAKELLMTWPSLGDSSLSTGGLAPGETFQSCCIFRMNGIFQSAHKIPCLQGGSNGLFFLQQIYQPRAKIQSRSEVKTLFQELTWVHWKSTWSPNHSHFVGLLTTV